MFYSITNIRAQLKILTVSIFLLPTIVFAQYDSFSCADATELNKTEGAKLISAAQNWYSELSSLSGEFSQNSYLAALDIGETSAGSFWFKKKGLLRWTYVHPEAQDFIIKEKTFWLYRPADSQVLVDNFNSILISDLPIAFLMGLGNLTKDFNFVSGCKNKSGNMLKLASRSKIKSTEALNDLSTFSLLLDQDGQTKAAQIEDVSGNITTILLNAVKKNTIITDQKFSTDFPKEVDVYDRRKEVVS